MVVVVVVVEVVVEGGCLCGGQLKGAFGLP
jgi:hypothetical protein